MKTLLTTLLILTSCGTGPEYDPWAGWMAVDGDDVYQYGDEMVFPSTDTGTYVLGPVVDIDPRTVYRFKAFVNVESIQRSPIIQIDAIENCDIQGCGQEVEIWEGVSPWWSAWLEGTYIPSSLYVKSVQIRIGRAPGRTRLRVMEPRFGPDG